MVKLLYPTVSLSRVWEITLPMLRELGVSALILDVDNTLATHDNPDPDPQVLTWLGEMEAAGVPMVLVSNNRRRRVQPFGEKLGLPCTAGAMKPLTKGFRETARKLALPPREIGVVGDQIFTDILGGNLFGAPTILVEPMNPEGGLLFRMKRRAELWVLERYHKAKERTHP